LRVMLLVMMVRMVGLVLVRMRLLVRVIHRRWVVIKLVIILGGHHHHHHLAVRASNRCCSRADTRGSGSRDRDASSVIVHRGHVGLTRHRATHWHTQRHSHWHRNGCRSRSTIRHSHGRVVVVVHGLRHLLLRVIVVAVCTIVFLIELFLSVAFFF
jgi:hypothetical protein